MTPVAAVSRIDCGAAKMGTSQPRHLRGMMRSSCELHGSASKVETVQVTGESSLSAAFLALEVRGR
jgi:hypothetical protein